MQWKSKKESNAIKCRPFYTRANSERGNGTAFLLGGKKKWKRSRKRSVSNKPSLKLVSKQHLWHVWNAFLKWYYTVQGQFNTDVYSSIAGIYINPVITVT